VLTAQTASFVANAQTASFVALAQSASNAVSAATASFANAFTVASTLTAQTLVVQTITSSVDFVTGSTRFGTLSSNTHIITGSMYVTGAFYVTTGSVGIGTSSPTATLQVLTNSGVSHIFETQAGLLPLYQYRRSGAVLANLANTDAVASMEFIARANSSWLTIAKIYAEYSGNGTTQSGNLQFYTSNAASEVERMRITSTGLVGIGATSPNYTLHIDSNTTLTRFQITNSTTGQGGGVGLQIIQNGLDASITNRSNGYLGLETVGTERMRITSGGNVAINAGGNLQLYRPDSSSPSTSWYWNIYMDSSNLLSFAVNGGTPKMIINASGNVGIGATSVNSEKLTINQTTGNSSALLVNTVGVTTGQSYGLTIQAGTNSSDRSFAVFNQAGSTNYFQVRGDGLIFAPGIYNNTNSNAANVWVNSDGSLYRSTASSIRYKENINDWNGSGLDTILALKPKTFKYKKDYYDKADIDFLGLIAEEVAEACPYLADYENEDRTGQVENVRYANIVVPLTKAIQELKAQNDDLQSQINELKAQ
jgi:hypothetical protein